MRTPAVSITTKTMAINKIIKYKYYMHILTMLFIHHDQILRV